MVTAYQACTVVLQFWGTVRQTSYPGVIGQWDHRGGSILPLPIRMPKALPYGQTHTGTGKVPIYKCTGSYVDKSLTSLR